MSSLDLTWLECAACGTVYSEDRPRNRCEECDSPLFTKYDYDLLGRLVHRADLQHRRTGLSRFQEVLPCSTSTLNEVSLGEGATPLTPVSRLAGRLGLRRLWIKDEGLNPTGTFKARGACVSLARLKELGVERAVLSSSGNAAAAWGAYSRRAGIEVRTVIPAASLESNRKELAACSSHVTVVDSFPEEAGPIVAELIEDGWFDARTLHEPYRLEGKKTMGYEMAESLGWSFPDVVVFPTGGGMSIVAIYKAWQELLALGWLTSETLPRLVCVQYEGCAPLNRAFEQGQSQHDPWSQPSVPPGGLMAPDPSAGALVLRLIRESEGVTTTVDVSEAERYLGVFARDEGIFTCFPAAAAVAGLAKLRESGAIADTESVVVMNTGAGIKYSSSLEIDADEELRIIQNNDLRKETG